LPEADAATDLEHAGGVADQLRQPVAGGRLDPVNGKLHPDRSGRRRVRLFVDRDGRGVLR
jgi:hypothetical protein